MRRTLTALLFLLALPAASARAADPPPASLIPNGDFQTLAADGQPLGWPLKSGASIEKDGDNRFLRLKVVTPGEQVLVYKRVDLKPEVKALELKYRVRHEGIARGEKQWFDGRIMMNFKDAAGQEVKPGPKHPSFNGTSKGGWAEKTQQMKVPEGTAYLEMLFTLFNAKAGQLDFDDVSLTAIPVGPLLAAEEEAAAKERARIAALPKPKPKVAAPAADKLPKPLHVEGNQIKDSTGKVVWLQGVAIPSMEWSAGGEHILESVDVAITQWKANVIRLPVASKFWNGVGPYQKDGGLQYRQTVDDAINLCASHGVFLVLDLHEYRAPTAAHAAFWTDAATKYKDHPAVIFELLNEPHGISWEVWRNGGRVTDKPKPNADGVLAENAEKLKGFDSIGMQGLLNAIRATGAKNMVIAGGLDWGYDLSGVLSGHALDDKGGNGIVYSSHVYPWKSDWKGKFLAAAEKYPLFIGETGAEQEKLSFIPPERQEDPYTWAPDMLGTIQKHKLNWTAWSFHPKAAPKALKDWTYEPTPYWGAFVKRALAGEQFEAKKVR
ncbi:MAG TPA: glycoside hydrolase family 5 protein [Humisphaera sp.]